jgi:hypothetical protein
MQPPTPGPLQQLLQRTVPSALEAARSSSIKVMQGDVRPVRFGEASFKSTGRTVVITGGSQVRGWRGPHSRDVGDSQCMWEVAWHAKEEGEGG